MIALIEIIILGFVETHKNTFIFARKYFSCQESINLLLGGEDWAKGVIINGFPTALEDDLFAVLPRTTIEGGYIEGAVRDAQGKFNVNDLKKLQYLPNFLKVMNQLKIEGAPSIQNAIILNNSSDPHQIFFNSITELRGLPDVTAKVFNMLSGFVTVLPEITALNINTANKYSLMILNDNINEQVADQIINQRSQRNFKSIDEFLANPVISASGIAIEREMITVDSQYFFSHIYVHYHDSDLSLYSLLKCVKEDNTNKVYVLWRSFDNL